jgi:hypothetical protein
VDALMERSQIIVRRLLCLEVSERLFDRCGSLANVCWLKIAVEVTNRPLEIDPPFQELLERQFSVHGY